MYDFHNTVSYRRNPEGVVEKNEEEEFAKGPLSILYQAVKNNTAVIAAMIAFNSIGPY